MGLDEDESTLYIGNLSHEVVSGDLWNFFNGHGRIKRVTLKRGYGFVEFESESDADAAMFELNWRDLKGRPVRLKKARRNGYRTQSMWPIEPNPPSASATESSSPRPFMDRVTKIRYYQTLGSPIDKYKYRLIVKNLTSRCKHYLREMMDECGRVTYASAHRARRRTGVVYFDTRPELQRAIERYQWEVIHGRRINLVDDTLSSPPRSFSSYRPSFLASPVACRGWSAQSADSVTSQWTDRPDGKTWRRYSGDHTNSFQTDAASIDDGASVMAARRNEPTGEAFEMLKYADFKSPSTYGRR